MKFIQSLVFINLIILLYSFKSLPIDFRGKTAQEVAVIISGRNQHTTPKKTTTKVVKTARLPHGRFLQKPIKKRPKKEVSVNYGKEVGRISRLQRFSGVVDGNIIYSGLPVTFKIDIFDFPLSDEAYLDCRGTGLASKYNYRILVTCEYLVTPEKEYEVKVSIKDTKKIDGIEADFVYTGDEELVLGEGASALIAGLIDTKMDRVQTAIGYATKHSPKNVILNSLVSAASKVNQKTKEHMQKSTLVLAVKDNKQVIVEFRRSFKYEIN